LFKTPGLWNLSQRKLLARSEDSLVQRHYVLQMARPEGQGCPDTVELTSQCHMSQTPDMELQDLVFALLCFSLDLVPFLLFVPLFLGFGNGSTYSVSLYVGSM
jgi:hypothetical protein